MLYIPNSKEFTITDDFIHTESKIVFESGPLHYHQYMEFEFIIKGNGINTQNGIPSPLTVGSAMLLTSSDFHQITINEPCTVCNISFNENLITPKLLSEIYKFKNTSCYIHFEEQALNEIKKLFDILNGSRSAQLDTYSSNYLLCILEAILNLALANIKSIDTDTAYTPDAFEKIIIHLYKHFRESPHLDDIAQLVEMNPSYVSRKFKDKFGISYMEFLTRLKLNFAKNLLAVSNYSVTDICYSSGFNSISNFMDAFKKYTGVTPAQYRAQNKSLRK